MERVRKRGTRKRSNSNWGGTRPGAGRPRSGEPPILLANRLARIEERLSDLAGLYAKAATVQSTQFDPNLGDNLASTSLVGKLSPGQVSDPGSPGAGIV